MTTTTATNNYASEADHLRQQAEGLFHMQADTWSRLQTRADAMGRAAQAEATGRIVLGGCGRECPPVEVVGVDHLPDERRAEFLECLARPKACGEALLALDGAKATVTRRGRWVIDLTRPAAMLSAFDAGNSPFPWAPSSSITQGGGHHAVVLWDGMPQADACPLPDGKEYWRLARSRMKARQEELAKELAATGMTPGMARRRREKIGAACAGAANRAIGALGLPTWGSADQIVAFAAAAEKQPWPESVTEDEVLVWIVQHRAAEVKAAKEKAEMAALEAEIAAEEAAKAKAEEAAKAAEATRIAAEQEAKTAAMLGMSPAEWQAMPEKKRRLALHNARRTGKI